MNIYPEIKKIAALNEKITQLIRKLQIKIDADGLDLGAAYFVKDCEERDNHLYDANGNQLDNDSYGPVVNILDILKTIFMEHYITKPMLTVCLWVFLFNCRCIYDN